MRKSKEHAQVLPLGKSFATNCARKRLFSSMNSCMPFEMTFTKKTHSADMTFDVSNSGMR